MKGNSFAMKLSVRNKVANGLVLCLIVPKAATTAAEMIDTYADGIAEFAADDDVLLQMERRTSDSVTVNADGSNILSNGIGEADPAGGDPTGGDPSGYDPSGFDPSGYDPSGGDPSACLPASTPPVLSISAPRQLVTAENGSSDVFEMRMEPDPLVPRTYRLESTDPSEAIASPDTVTFHNLACIPQTIQVIGQNDYFLDGDINYAIEVIDEQDFVVDTIPGVNLDNDDYVGVAVDVLGPTSIPQGGSGVFQIRVANVSGAPIKRNTLTVETTSDLQITDFAVGLLSGDPYRGNIKLQRGALTGNNVRIDTNDMLVLVVDVMLDSASTTEQVVSARFVNDPTSQQVDDSENVRTAVP